MTLFDMQLPSVRLVQEEPFMEALCGAPCVGIFAETLETVGFFMKASSVWRGSVKEVKKLFDAVLHQKSDVRHEVPEAILG